MHPLSNTREGLIQLPAAAANLTEGLLALIDVAGKAALATPSTAAARFLIVDSDANYATLCPIEPGRQVRVKLAGTCNPGDPLAVTAASKAAVATSADRTVLLAEEAGVDGQMVLARGVAYLPVVPSLPTPGVENAQSVIAVNAAGTAFVTGPLKQAVEGYLIMPDGVVLYLGGIGRSFLGSTTPEGGSSTLIMGNLPTSDPGVIDAVWNDSGTLKVSTGS
ncbi:MAG: hypothetical protein KJ579_01770 [Verrucomicrobia bacterium]|nr:hypothetical protein [Verrucomicrobiota bacterium]